LPGDAADQRKQWRIGLFGQPAVALQRSLAHGLAGQALGPEAVADQGVCGRVLTPTEN
jgi:hypothetical protein